jgi:anthranilate synthase component 2
MSDKSKIYIIDFEDSFTFNIATELFKYEQDIQVVSHSDFFSFKEFPKYVEKFKTPTAIVLGPGPGDPEEYREYFPLINILRSNPMVYLMGICLGHQIFALIDGMSVRASLKPTHGGQVKINFDSRNMLVQRYNSLGVFESPIGKNEIQVRQWTRGVSYQFHPESIGTENRSLFFKDLLDFLVS